MDKQNNPNRSLSEEILDDLIIRMDKLENQEIQMPDYSRQFGMLEKVIKDALPQFDKPLADIQQVVEQQKMVAELLQNQHNDVKAIIKELPKSIPVRHTLDIKAKGVTFAIITVFLLLALLFGFCLHLWNENSGLEANDIKFRSIRQMSPEWTHWADTTYARNPEAMKKNTIKFENDALEKAEAEAIAKQKDKEAKDAKKRLKKLRAKK
ncbi:hypothetical protein [Mucilaginibacter jinjuensis]|uniref:Uncharacterized protein n=1 Tax=Mucilaginibacter jinjuensis TaxID=1176721 RepID=A0ABY7T716_9SPHI|nr:hypothetical protein [Mucilaginibacter jinjuensis]WCT12290.1 hypothetical protein PQO05_26560 [Mucilaginibacter jinjuensis]